MRTLGPLFALNERQVSVSSSGAHEMLPIYVAIRSWLKSHSCFPLVQMGPSCVHIIERIPICWRILWHTGLLKDKGKEIKESLRLLEWQLILINKILHYIVMFLIFKYLTIINKLWNPRGWYTFVKDLFIIGKVISIKILKISGYTNDKFSPREL